MGKTFTTGPNMSDWQVKVERPTHDVYSSYGARSQVIPGRPILTMEFRGKPVTIDEKVNGNKRIAIWMPGEQMRTAPLVEQTFTPDDFHRRGKEALIEHSKTEPMFQGPLGFSEAFMVWWARENYHAILDAEDKRERSNYFRDMGMWSRPEDPVEIEHLIGEDGKKYAQLKPNRAARQRALQAELEELEGYGSF